MSNTNFHQLGDQHFISPASTTMATQPGTPFANTTVPPITPPTVVNGGGSPPPLVTLPSVGESNNNNPNNTHSNQHHREEQPYLGSPTASGPGTTAGSLYDCRGSNLGASQSSTFGSRSQLSQRAGSQQGFCDPAAALMASPQRATEMPLFHSQPQPQTQPSASRHHQPLRRTDTGDSLLASRRTTANTTALRGALSPNDGPSSIASDLCDLGGGADHRDLGDGDTWERPQSPLKPPPGLTTNPFATLHLGQSQDGEDQA